MVTITLPDNSMIEMESGSTVLDIAGSIGKGLAKAALAAKVDGVLVDTSYRIKKDCNIEVLTEKSPEPLEILRHSTAHVMASAVKNLFPGVKFAIGPSIEHGFYYDFDVETAFTEEDLKKIDEEMQNIIKADEPFVRIEKSRKEAIQEMQTNGEIYKVELLQQIEDETISFYKTGNFIDLCRGPHIPSTGFIKAFKLITIAGAYWRGDSSNIMLQRIYGTAFFSKKDIKEHIRAIEEAKKRDHRKIGADLDLFSFHEQAPGLPFWHNNGVIIYNEIVNFWKEIHSEFGYQEIKTPLILNEDLWHLSGHWDNYKDKMYFTKVDEKDYAIKPMNCPGGLLIFANKLHSYRDLPVRVAELGTVHRHELRGVLHGLFRARAFTQDDAHIFCTPSQIEDEIVGVINLFVKLYTSFGLTDYRLELSTKPAKAIGSDEIWDISETALKNALERFGDAYELNPGNGAFYGPKIDFHINDCMNRSWQCGTIQLDFSMPQRFADSGLNIKYIDRDNSSKTPVMIHRAALGSLERFIGIIIEEYAGKLPLWLSPVQALIANITDSHKEYAQTVYSAMKERGLRPETDFRNEKLGYKIREAIMRKIPYIFVIGDKEVANGTVTIRHRDINDIGTFEKGKVLDMLADEYRNRRLTSVFSEP